MNKTIPTLIQISDLSAEYLKNLATEGEQRPLYIRYDSLSDILMLLLAPPQTETVVHHVDKYVSLLYMPDTMDIVGIQIEDFEHSFLPKHEEVRRVWRLRETPIEWPEDFGDIVLIFERMKRNIVNEVVRATKETLEPLGESAESLKQALMHDFELA